MKFYVIGDVTVDHLYHLNHIPAPGEEVSPIRSTMQPGGAGGTMSVTLARLGHEVSLAASVGSDPFAEVALKYVRESGVNTSPIQVIEDLLTSTITVMQTPDGKRAMISSGDANRQLDAAKLKKKDIESSDGLLVSAYSLIGGPQREYAIKAISYAKKASVPVLIDLGTGAVNAAGVKLLDTVLSADYLLLNRHELQTITETDNISDALLGLKDRGAGCVIVKVGAHGSIIWTPQETDLVESVPLGDEVVDSTGAGDTFSAVFAHAILSGKPLKQAAKMANLAGALAATAVGAQRKTITQTDLESVLA
ncbi:carbohydrate kinase family protein [Deinococcus cellulosilyticus]|uniref:Sugar kinase n=1 Tax=Deinococcus cellulosilyticus (strain DSM 18568 / NBRC 106333 / KACC 11606 / 5516J-15) TaxID=1223518 RepID=A0A511MXG2_DEIC1|nr:carbohydrate kinase family protein [Deinococcus cellulosilyticus]GEM45282.1 sugar kinase [Deinococcus cellulosilyticus NBRC 106333 = KACC 11606]